MLSRAASAQTEELEGPNEQISSPVVPPSDSGVYSAIKQLPESIRSSAPFARAYYDFERRAGSSGVFDYESYFRAYEQAQNDWKRASGIAYKSKSPGVLSNWTNIGVISTGPTSHSAGCTVAIAFDPTNSNIMYAGAQGGGVWKSVDHGSSWVPLTDYALPNMTVASIAVDQKTPSTIWVGTGDCNNGEPYYSGSGLWRSTNGGADWQKVNVTGSSALSFVKVLVDPSNSNVVFASAYDGAKGLYRSEDGGATWTRVYSGGWVWDIAAGKVEGGQQTYFLVDGGNNFSASSKAGVYKSLDDGKTWTKVDATNFPASSQIGRSVLAVASAAQDNVFLLMSSVNGGDSVGYMVSTDAGTSWQPRQLPAYLFKGELAGFAAQGWYDICIAVHPSGSPVYIGGVQAFANYGRGWEIFSGYSDALPKTAPHVDHHALALDPNNPGIVFNGNDGGLYKSDDAGHSWNYSSTNMVTNRFYHIGFERINQSAVWAGAQDQGTWRLGVGADTAFFGGDGMQPIPSPVSSSLIYYELPQGEVRLSTNFRGDGGTAVTSTALCGDQSGWDAPVKMSLVGHAGGNASDLVYVGRQNLWRATDGHTFKKVGGSGFTVPGYPYITSIGLSPTNSDVLYVGGPGKVQFSTNFGTSWTSRSTGVSGEVSSIELTGRDDQFVLISTRGPGGVLISTNQGTSWTKVNGVSGSSLPSADVESVALDSTSPTTTWYAATDVGFYFTTDAGQHWQMTSGLPIVACRDIQIRRDGTILRVATYGRGVWQATVEGARAVDFSTLSAQKSDAGTVLTWSASSDDAQGTFEIERSIGDESFTKIASITANGGGEYNFVDATTTSGSYLFRVARLDASGTLSYSNIVEVTYGSNQLLVHAPRPNPMVRGTAPLAIDYELPSRQIVAVSIYNALGTRIATLGRSAMREPGSYTEEWDGRDFTGQLAPAGVYFYHIEAGDLGNYTGRLSIQ